MDISGWEFQFRKGLLDLLVLNLVWLGRNHGYELLKGLKDKSFDVRAGNLYTVLGRLEKKGYLKSYREWSAASLAVDSLVFEGKSG